MVMSNFCGIFAGPAGPTILELEAQQRDGGIRKMTDDEDKVYAAIFDDDSGWFKYPSNGRLFHRKLNGVTYGAVLATRSPKFENFAFNEDDKDRALAGLRDGKVDRMRAVWARRNEDTGRWEYCKSEDIEKLSEKLKNLTPRNGKFGRFYTLGLDDDEEEKF
jgi:hypothetical protein